MKSNVSAQNRSRSVVSMSTGQAREFFLKTENYSNLDLPPYFDFAEVLQQAALFLEKKPLASLKLEPKIFEDINYTIYTNKDGRYVWRPIQLIHPVIYVDLVCLITELLAWDCIKSRFAEFARDPKIKSLGIPRESLTMRKNKGAQIYHWWQEVEQASIELALDFRYVFQTDIAECYSSICTHSIAWAVHGKEKAKEKKHDQSLIGNAIACRIQDMQHGQTIGIPQGSVLMDLIGELVLGYADLELSKRLADANITDFQILRYRDDYRIFVNESQTGERIMKTLVEVLIGLGLKLNASKTTNVQTAISSSLKSDKLKWLLSRQENRSLQKHLLLIHSHGTAFPNSGSLIGSLDGFYRRIAPLESVPNPMQLISIAIDIGYNSPRCFPVCAAIVSKLLSTLPTKEDKIEAFDRIWKKLKQIPNNGHIEVWLQRISYPLNMNLDFEERLCLLVEDKKMDLWNNSWITNAELKAIVEPSCIVNKNRLNDLQPIIQPDEFEMFFPY